jgi:hypothetical protein
VDGATPIKKGRSRKALNADNLEALGAPRLAAILLDIADGQTTTKRRLRMELAAEVGAGDLVLELEKHLDVISAARGKVHWRKLKALRDDLGLLRRMIAGRLAQADPAAAVQLLLRFLGLERDVLARVRDVKGEIAHVFEEALDDLAGVAAVATLTSAGPMDGIYNALENARLGVMGKIMRALVAALDPEAIAQLRGRIETEMAPRRRVNAGWRDALHALMDAQGDAQSYAATYSASEKVLPPIGARIAERLLKAGQIKEAEQALEISNPNAVASASRKTSSGTPISEPGVIAWESARIDLLDAEGNKEAAQAARWAAFERDLSAERLRAYIHRLSDFDDVVATDRAIDHARNFRPFMAALGFLVSWPALNEAANLIAARTGEIDGLAIDTLEPAARALEGRHPLAATLLLRAMVRDIAKFSQIELYPRAKAWLLEAASLEAQITDFQGYEDHVTFERSVRSSLGRAR